MDNTKYSNLYNYCGIPSYLNNTNNATNQTINNQTVKKESKIEKAKNETNATNQTINNQTVKNESNIEYVRNETNATNQTIKNQTVKNESKIEYVKNGTNNTINNQTGKSGNVTQKENQSLQNFTKEKERETEKVEILENNPKKNLSNMTKNRTNFFNKNNTSIELNKKKKSGKNFLQKPFNYLSQQDMNFYIMVICAFVVIVTLIAFFIFVCIWRKKAKKRYIIFKETVSQNVNPNNISVMTSNDSEVKSEAQTKA